MNSVTVKYAPSEAMIQLGICLQQLISTLADIYNENTLLRFVKLDIKDGFCSLAVSDTDYCSLCYVLPQDNKIGNIEDIEVLLTNCLQMVWCESPPFLCTTSETSRYVIDTILH